MRTDGTCTSAFLHMYVCVCMFGCLCDHLYLYVCVCVCVCACVYVRVLPSPTYLHVSSMRPVFFLKKKHQTPPKGTAEL